MSCLGYPLFNISGITRSYASIPITRAGRSRKSPPLIEETKVSIFVPEEVLTAEQVAEELKVNIRRVYRWIQDGELLATDLGTPSRHHYRIQRADLEGFKRRRRTGQK